MTAYNPEPKDIDINSSAAELRNYTLAFVSFLLYVLITAASTTHEQLLRISAVKLPLLDIDIPIVQFYLVSPLLILILHFHLLLQHFLFSQQFYSFDAALKLQYPDHADRVRFMKSLSGNLSLVHLLGGYQKTAVQILLAAILAICLLIFPLFDLWFLQARFLPFHDNDYTNWQVLMVVMDCVMVLALLPKTFDENDNAFRWWLSVFSPLWWLKRLYLYSLRRFYHFFYQRGSLRFFNRVWLNKAEIKSKLKNLIQKYQAALQVKIVSFKQFLVIAGFFSFVAVIFLLSVFVSTLPQFEYEENENLFINDREKWLVNYLPKCGFAEEFEKTKDFRKYISEISFQKKITNFCKIKIINIGDLRFYRWSFFLTTVLHEKIYSSAREPFLFRNLNLAGKVITADEHLTHDLENTFNKETTLEKIEGINLKDRDLRYANFIGAKLPKADLRNANLTSVNFELTQLQYANLRETKLQYSALRATELQGADLASANLKGADIRHANLQGSHLSFTNFQDSDLEHSELQSAELSYANLKGASLIMAELKGSNLDSTKLQGSNLKLAELQGAILKNVEYGKYIDPKTKKLKSTKFPIDGELKPNVHCLTDVENSPICKKYNPDDKNVLKKVAAYWINDLACSSKWIAQGIINNYLSDDRFTTYLIPLLKKKLTDKDCLGIQNLPDDFKQQIKDAIKQP